MTSKRKDQIRVLLKGIETGDEASVAVVNPDKYIHSTTPKLTRGVRA